MELVRLVALGMERQNPGGLQPTEDNQSQRHQGGLLTVSQWRHIIVSSLGCQLARVDCLCRQGIKSFCIQNMTYILSR